MAEYKGIQGYSVQSLASDPSPTASVVGQLWYNSTSSSYKIAVSGPGVWAAGNSRSTGVQGAFGTGSQTAAISMGGNLLPGVLSYNCETYDGTSWTEVNDLLNGSGHQAENIGTQTAALSVGSSYVPKSKTVLYNGTSWTELNDLTGDRSNTGGCGTSTAALICGGQPTTTTTNTWNGTSWSTGNNITTGRNSPGSAMQASNTTALIFGGSTPGSTAKTEEYDGTSWSEVGDLSGPISENCGFGTGSAALTVSGLNSGPPTITTATQEWNSPVLSIKTVTVT